MAVIYKAGAGKPYGKNQKDKNSKIFFATLKHNIKALSLLLYFYHKQEVITRIKCTIVVSMSPGDRLISSGEVIEERVVRGVLGEGSVSQALYPLGGGVGI